MNEEETKEMLENKQVNFHKDAQVMSHSLIGILLRAEKMKRQHEESKGPKNKIENLQVNKEKSEENNVNLQVKQQHVHNLVEPRVNDMQI